VAEGTEEENGEIGLINRINGKKMLYGAEKEPLSPRKKREVDEGGAAMTGEHDRERIGTLRTRGVEGKGKKEKGGFECEVEKRFSGEEKGQRYESKGTQESAAWCKRHEDELRLTKRKAVTQVIRKRGKAEPSRLVSQG